VSTPTVDSISAGFGLLLNEFFIIHVRRVRALWCLSFYRCLNFSSDRTEGCVP
jgi:hypothetical protein